MNSAQELSPRNRTGGWKRPLAFAALLCLPLIVGLFARVLSPVEQLASTPNPTPSAPLEHAASEAIKTEGEGSSENATVFIASFAEDEALVVQTEQEKEGDQNKQQEKEGDQNKQQEKEGDQNKDEAKPENKPQPEPKVEEKDNNSPTEKAQPTSEKAGSQGDDIVCCDATSEFEHWILKLDDNIRQAVVDALTTQLQEATDNLDRKHALLERLYVEAELHKMQVQHLRHRLQEWKPIKQETHPLE